MFSEYQLDFALSDDGIENYSGGNRKLSTGNNGNSVINFINEGYSPVLVQNFGEEFYERYPIDYSDVFEIQNAEYFFPNSLQIIGTSNNSKIDNIKKYIMTNGSLIVDTASPLGSCSHTDSDGNIFIDSNSACYSEVGHSMSVIGWDDNYQSTYEFENELHEIKGAWILKNSWGSLFPYVYLSYDSEGTEYYGLGMPEDINFDNSYSKAYNEVSNNILISKYNKPSDSIENINKISFYHNGRENNEYMVYISNDGSDNYKYVDTIVPEFPGRTSIDMSEYNDEYRTLDSDSFSVKIVSNNYEGYSSFRGIESVYVFTENENLTNEIGVKINDNDEDITQNQLTLLKYVKKNQDYIYTYKVNEQFSKDEETNLKVNVYYENDLIEEKDLIVQSNKPISPYVDGSLEYPFIIMTEEQFLKISENDETMNYSYILGNNLDFSNYTDIDFYNPIGTYENPFTGTFDGNGYTISNLNANYKTQKSSLGLFGYTANAVIKNLKLENCSFTSSKAITDFGMISGKDKNSEINNITIYGGSSNMHAKYAGSFVGYSELGAYTNIYSSHSLNIDSPSYYGGLVGYLKNGGISTSAFTGKLDYQNFDKCGGITGIAINSFMLYIDSSFEGNSENGYYGISHNITNSVVDNVVVYIKTSKSRPRGNSYISHEAIESTISNIYELDYAKYNYEPMSSYQNTILKNIRHADFNSTDIETLFDLNVEKWKYINNKPYLKNLNYNMKKFSLPGISYEYLFDSNDFIIYNVRIPSENQPLTYKKFKENFEVYNAEAYSIDGTKKLEDNDFIVTGSLIKFEDYNWRVAVTGMVNVQNENEGIIDIGDSIIMARILAKLSVNTNVFSEEEYEKIIRYAGDLNCSKSFDIGDYGILRRKLAEDMSYNIYASEGKSCYVYANGGV